jgi:hypothetical protein
MRSIPEDHKQTAEVFHPQGCFACRPKARPSGMEYWESNPFTKEDDAIRRTARWISRPLLPSPAKWYHNSKLCFFLAFLLADPARENISMADEMHWKISPKKRDLNKRILRFTRK